MAAQSSLLQMELLMELVYQAKHWHQAISDMLTAGLVHWWRLEVLQLSFEIV